MRHWTAQFLQFFIVLEICIQNSFIHSLLQLQAIFWLWSVVSCFHNVPISCHSMWSDLDPIQRVSVTLSVSTINDLASMTLKAHQNESLIQSLSKRFQKENVDSLGSPVTTRTLVASNVSVSHTRAFLAFRHVCHSSKINLHLLTDDKTSWKSSRQVRATVYLYRVFGSPFAHLKNPNL